MESRGHTPDDRVVLRAHIAALEAAFAQFAALDAVLMVHAAQHDITDEVSPVFSNQSDSYAGPVAPVATWAWRIDRF